LELYGLGAFSFWLWNPDRNLLSTHGAFSAESLEEWMTRIHPRDQSAFSSFLDRDWEAGPSVSRIEYRFNANRSGDWAKVRHCAMRVELAGEWQISGMIEIVAFPQHSRTPLDRLERQFEENGARIGRFVETALSPGNPDDLGSLLELLRRHLGAELVTLVRSEEIHEEAGENPTGALLAKSIAAGDCGNQERPYELDLDLPETPCFLVCPLPGQGGSIPGALCAGFRTQRARGEARRLTGLLALSVAFASRRLRHDEDELHRRELLLQLRRAQRLSGLGRLSGGFAHEFKNLLTVVQGHLHLLEQSLAGGSPRSGLESLRQIRIASDQAEESVGRLLLFGNGAPAALSPCDLNRVIERFVAMMRRVLEENIEIRLDLAPGAAPIRADEGGLREALMSLIVHARDAMPGGGLVTLETRSVENPARKNPVRGEPVDGPWFLLRVRHSVHGHHRHAAPHLPPSEPSEPRDEGRLETGLELHHVAAIVDEHGGVFESGEDDGNGFSFRIFLPAESGVAAPERPTNRGRSQVAKERLGDTNLKGTTILLVEDETAVRKLVRKLLEVLGCKVIEAASGREALDLWPGIRHRVSLVVSDIVMPEGVSGWDLARELHHRHPDLGILLTSGYSELPEDHGLGNIPQIGYLQKPYGVNVLRSSLARLLETAGLPG